MSVFAFHCSASWGLWLCPRKSLKKGLSIMSTRHSIFHVFSLKMQIKTASIEGALYTVSWTVWVLSLYTSFSVPSASTSLSYLSTQSQGSTLTSASLPKLHSTHSPCNSFPSGQCWAAENSSVDASWGSQVQHQLREHVLSFEVRILYEAVLRHLDRN